MWSMPQNKGAHFTNNSQTSLCPLVWKLLRKKRNSSIVNRGYLPLICPLSVWFLLLFYLSRKARNLFLKRVQNKRELSIFPITAVLPAKLICRISNHPPHPLHFPAQIHLPNPQQTGNCVNTEVELIFPQRCKHRPYSPRSGMLLWCCPSSGFALLQSLSSGASTGVDAVIFLLRSCICQTAVWYILNKGIMLAMWQSMHNNTWQQIYASVLT